MAPKARLSAFHRSMVPKQRAMSDRLQMANDLLNSSIPVTITECEVLLQEVDAAKTMLIDSIDTFETYDKEWLRLIDGIMDADDLKAELNLYDEKALDDKGYVPMVEACRNVRSKLQALAKTLERRLDTTAALKNGSSESESVTTTHSTRPIKAKLPKLTLPMFDGKNLLEWNQFWTIFAANVDSQAITNTEKFSYLVGLLRGTALETIKGVTISDTNYDTAVSLLRERFDRSKGSVVSRLYGELKRIPCSQKSATSVRQTYNTCEAVLRQLEAAGQNLDSNTSLAIDVLSKYPPTIITDLYQRYSISEDSSVSAIRKAILKCITDYESLSDTMSHLHMTTETRRKPDVEEIVHNPAFERAQTTRPQNYSTGTTSAFVALPSESTSPANRCYFCGWFHFNCECPRYTTSSDRIARLQQTGRCTRCGRFGHQPAQCKHESLQCFYCQSRSHCSSICPIRYPEPRRSKPPTIPGKTFTASAVSQPQPISDVKPKNRCPTQPTTKPLNDGGSRPDSDLAMLNKGKRSVLSTALTLIVNPKTGMKQRARIVLDSGSHRTYVTESASRKLMLCSDSTEQLDITVFGTKRTLTIKSHIVNFQVVLRDGSTKMITANTTPLITEGSILPQGLSTADLSILNSMKPALAEDFGDPDGTVDVLLGNEYFWDFVNGAPIPISPTLRLIPSTLGLLLGGRYESQGDQTETTMLCITETTSKFHGPLGLIATDSKTKIPYPDIDEYWDLERIGITDDPVENDNDKALNKFNDTVYYENGRYNVQWPWIEEKRQMLRPNYELSLGRLKSLVKRFQNEESEVVAGYQDVIEKQVANGVIEEVPTDDKSEGTIHYLPHHPVVKKSSATTKVRVVYDASAKVRTNSVSLNECMYRGPVLLPHLCEVLLRFRLFPIVVIADVEKAFLQVALQPSERDATRFLWVRDPKKMTTDNNLVTYRFCRVPFGVIASPFLLAATIQHHLQQYRIKDSGSTEIAKMIADNIYVDNITCGATTEEDAKRLWRTMESMFKEAGMRLQEFCSNSDAVLDDIPEQNRIKSRKVKMLGLTWESEADTLQIVRRNLKADPTTKRTILHAVASIFDPMGFYQPVTLPAKCLLQELWQRKFSWDDDVPEDIQQVWDKLVEQFDMIFDQAIPRHIPAASDLTIVTFCDASAKGYATAVYVRYLDPATKLWASTLVYSKSRLAPKTTVISLPRLELLGVVIGVRASEFVRNALKRTDTTAIDLFTDSEVTLHWIRTSRLLSRFVGNQVAKIKAAADVTFHHVKSEENPADYCTRGRSTVELNNSKLWWNGPDWLSQPTTQWPITNIEPIKNPQLDQFQSELRSTEVSFLAGKCDTPEILQFSGIKIDRFSTLRKLLLVTTLVLTFLKRLVWNRSTAENRAKHKGLSALFDEIDDDDVPTARSVQSAKNGWLKAAQRFHYDDVFNALINTRKHRLVEQLGLQIDSEGLIRSHSRYGNSRLSTDSRFPKLLGKSCRLTEMVVIDQHTRLMHAGVAQTLDHLRSEYWIPQGRAVVQRVLRKCVTCRRYRGARFALPPMPDWPRDRIMEQPPFGCIGLDFFGPINVKIGDCRQKCWVCLFTCLTVRAVHLEVVADCSSIEFLNCLIRFVSRRGVPKIIISDNAGQFQAVQTLIDRGWFNVLHDTDVRSFFADRGIQWKFIVPLAPWQGGFYERLVKVVKNTLKVAVGRRLLTWQEFVTVVTETEAIVNSRPITYVHSDRDSAFVTVRPIDFITELPTCQPNIDVREIELANLGDASKRVAEYWKYRQVRKRQIWDSWRSEYLLSLRERGSRMHRPRRPEINSCPSVNDIVIVYDNDLPRGSWKLAKVTRLMPSSDGSTRAVELQLPNRAKIRRTINFLYPLEIEHSGSAAADESNSPLTDDVVEASGHVVSDDDDFQGFSAEDIQHTLDTLRRYDDDDTILGNSQDAALTIYASVPVKRRLSTESVLLQLGSGLVENPIEC